MPKYPGHWRCWSIGQLRTIFGVPKDDEEAKLFRQFRADQRRAVKEAASLRQVQAEQAGE